MTKTITLKDYLNSRYKTTVWLTFLSFIVMSLCNILLFYHEGIAPLKNFSNYETESQIQMLKGNQVDQYYSRYSSILLSKSFSGIYSIYQHYNDNLNILKHEFITPGSEIINERDFFWFDKNSFVLGFNWSAESPLYLNIVTKKKIDFEDVPEHSMGYWNFFVFKKYNLTLNLLMLIPDLFILLFGVKYHLKLKSNHRDVIEQFKEAEKLFSYNFNEIENQTKSKSVLFKHDIIISEFLTLRSIALKNAKLYIEQYNKYKKIELDRKYVEQQKDLFNNINKTNHDFSKTLESCKILLKNKINSDQILSKYEIANLSKQLSYCSRLVTNFKDLATPLRGRNRAQDLEELLQSLELEHNKHFIKEKNIKIIITLDQSYLYCLDDGFERVFNNIISNALEHTPSNKEFYICNQISDDKIEFKFKNTGIFIESERLELLSSLFESKKIPSFKNKGNGLIIANEILKAHSGKLKISTSKEEKWVEVCVVLPKIVLINIV